MGTKNRLKFRHRLNSTATFRLTDQEKETIIETANDFNVTVSEYLRASLITTLKRQRKESL